MFALKNRWYRTTTKSIRSSAIPLSLANSPKLTSREMDWLLSSYLSWKFRIDFRNCTSCFLLLFFLSLSTDAWLLSEERDKAPAIIRRLTLPIRDSFRSFVLSWDLWVLVLFIRKISLIIIVHADKNKEVRVIVSIKKVVDKWKKEVHSLNFLPRDCSCYVGY